MPYSQLQLRRDTSSNWTYNNPILAAGEIGMETDTRKIKIGNGITPWSGITHGGFLGPTGPNGRISISGDTYISIDNTSGNPKINYNGISNIVASGNITVTQNGKVRIVGYTNTGGSIIPTYIQDQNVTIGYRSGENNTSLTADTIAIGNEAGFNNQGSNAIAIGKEAGSLTSFGSIIGIGNLAAYNSFGSNIIGIGNNAGRDASANSINIGRSSGSRAGDNNLIAIGTNAGSISYIGAGTICIGGFTSSAGLLTYGAPPQSMIRVGHLAGLYTSDTGTNRPGNRDSSYTIAIGYTSGFGAQSAYSIAIGNSAAGDGYIYSLNNSDSFNANICQFPNSIAIGNQAGFSIQQTNCIAIGALAGVNNQPANSIILNAESGITLDAATSGFFVSPVSNRPTTGLLSMWYNPTSREICFY
jgi:hypothetical protein